MDINTERLGPGDIGKFTILIRLFENVFEMKDFQMPEESYLLQLLNSDDFFVVVALHKGQVIGGLTSYILQQYYSRSPLIYIFDLAVKTEFRRKGVGRMLIAENNRYARQLHAEAVMVQADEEDSHAIEFYRSTGATGQNVIHFDYMLAPNDQK